MVVDLQPMKVVVDDLFPFDKTANHFAFCKPSHNGATNKYEIWPMLLEKAWAKIMGAYCLMDMGTSQEVFMAIEGAPS
jgi:hypothetical protein